MNKMLLYLSESKKFAAEDRVNYLPSTNKYVRRAKSVYAS